MFIIESKDKLGQKGLEHLRSYEVWHPRRRCFICPPTKKRKIKGVLESREQGEIQGGRPEIKIRIHNNLRSRIALLCVVSELCRQSELGLYIVIVI